MMALCAPIDLNYSKLNYTAMKHFNLLKTLLLLCALIVGSLSGWADTYEQLTSIANIDESAEYVLGIDGTGFHYEGTSSWGKTALPSAHTPIYYTLKKANDGNSFTAEATIGSTKYYLQVPTSNTFSMATSTGTNTDLIIGTTQVSGTNYAVANKTTTARHLRINGTSGLRSYAGTTGTMAFFYKRVPDSPANAITASSNNDSWGSVSLSGNVITATPATGYTYADPAYSVNPANSAIVAQDGNKFTVTPSADTEVTINFAPIPTHTATFSVNGVTAMQEYIEGADITFPSNPASIDDKVFMGWVNTAIVGTSDDAPSFISSATMGKTDVTFYAVFANKETSGGEVIKSYGFETISDADWTIDGPARAEGNAYTGSYSGRINSNNTYVTFNSKVKVKEFSFVLKRTSTNSNYNVYVETSPDKSTWTAAATYPMDDFGNGSYTSKTKTFDGNTELYVRFHCYNTTAVRYVDDITIKYDDVTTTYTNYCTSVVAASVARPVITLAANPFTFSTTATITCATNGADIKYSYDGENWSDYSAPLTITETKTIYAKAVLNSDESQVASVKATKNLVEPTVTIDATGITNTNVFAGTDAGSLSASVAYNEVAVEGATVTWSGNNDAVATINASTGAVTLVGAGSVTFTATYAGNGDYSEKTASYNMTVIYDDPNAPGTINNPLTVADVNSGSYSGDNYVTGYIVGFFVSKDDDAANSGKTNLALSDTPDEKSGANTIAIQLPSGTLRTSWNIEDNNVIGYKVLVYGSVESYYTGKTGVKNTSEITAVSVPVSISAAGWATYSSNYPLDFTGITALTAYTASKKGSAVKFNKVTGKVPANTGLLVRGETANVPVCASAEAVSNLLEGVTTDTPKGAGTIFVLMKGSKGIGFYKNTNDFTLRANSAYLPAEDVEGSTARAFIALDEETTGIADVRSLKDNTESMFDLQGRKIAKPTKGLYIVNGKKVVVK